MPAPDQKICSAHFYGGNKADHPLHPAYIPTLFPGNVAKAMKEGARDMFNYNHYMKLMPVPGIAQQPVILQPDCTDAQPEFIKLEPNPCTELIRLKPNSRTELIKLEPNACTEFMKVEPSPCTESIQTEPDPCTQFVKVEHDSNDADSDMCYEEFEPQRKDFECQVSGERSQEPSCDYTMCNMRLEKGLHCAEVQVDLRPKVLLPFFFVISMILYPCITKIILDLLHQMKERV